MNSSVSPRLKISFLFLGMIFFCACVRDTNFDAPEIRCGQQLKANATFLEVKNLYVDATVHIQEDLIIEGYVISSDEAGNFFTALHFQDGPVNPTEGFQLDIDVRDSHLFYEVGSRIVLKLKGLYLGKSKEVYKLGGIFTSFGTVSVGRLPASMVQEHIFLYCDEAAEIQPQKVFIKNLGDKMVNTLISISDMEVISRELEQPYAEPEEETKRTLTDCEGNEIVLLNSGFSDFQETLLPGGNGDITGVLYRDRNEYQLIIRDLNDISFLNERCVSEVNQNSSEQLFISELADPDNNSGARFVELYNAGAEELNLTGWTLRRYTNANTEIGSSVDLSWFTISSQGTLVIAPNAGEFEMVYGFSADLGVGKNSAADSNGDDNMELVDPGGKIIDTFGVIGEDGSGTNHEFEDGRALRNDGIIKGNPVFAFEEWTIYNDTGDSGTQKLPQNAPEDFTPGER